MASPLSYHLSRCNSWTCALRLCWTMCSAFSPTTWSRRLAATTPPAVLRWRPCRRSCATFWSYAQKTGPVMTPIWFSTVGTHTKALALGLWLVRDPHTLLLPSCKNSQLLQLNLRSFFHFCGCIKNAILELSSNRHENYKSDHCNVNVLYIKDHTEIIINKMQHWQPPTIQTTLTNLQVHFYHMTAIGNQVYLYPRGYMYCSFQGVHGKTVAHLINKKKK